ncbi:hypothetical protein [uncultured Tateyamaria sp.]|uniref:hypothetical protein n=1 Tax=Tateyamaria sp. 1078 TaxID=3417464 RepID=UPI00260E192F|nr:hypothetical protein [uncultured Tateyamaria sp.]
MGQDVFAERLARLGAEHGQRAELQTQKAQAARGTRPEWVTNLGYPASIVGACFLGLLAVVLARYCMFHINGAPDPGADADLTMIIDGALAFGIAFVLRMAFYMSDKVHLAAKTVGIWIALTCMHNLVHDYPDLWAAAFSEDWVERTTEMTEPRSFYFRGYSFEFSGAIAAEPAATDKPEIKINRF